MAHCPACDSLAAFIAQRDAEDDRLLAQAFADEKAAQDAEAIRYVNARANWFKRRADLLEAKVEAQRVPAR